MYQKINKDIFAPVPSIQQERIFNVGLFILWCTGLFFLPINVIKYYSMKGFAIKYKE
jgi:hypothetical protein